MPLQDLICSYQAYNFIPMTDRISILNKLKQKHANTYKEAIKSYSERPRKKNEGGWAGRASEVIPQAIGYVLMKEKFEQMYRHIEQLSFQQHDQLLVKSVYRQSNFQRSASIDISPEDMGLEIVHVDKKFSLPSVTTPQLEVNTVAEYTSRSRGAPVQTQFLRKSSKTKKMHDLGIPSRPKLSNNIKDYLSVQKISIKEMQESLLAHKMRMLKNYNQSNLLAFNNSEQDKSSQQLPRLKSIMVETPVKQKPENIFMRKPTKFKPPFELYYYRDFMWKVAFSNDFLVEPVEEYQTKLKYYVGPGNNSNLIKGIMKRRPWFQLADKIQDAQFIWTQIKNPTIFQGQKKGDSVPMMTTIDKSIDNESIVVKKEGCTTKFSLFNTYENQKWNNYWAKNVDKERITKQNLKARTKILAVKQHPLAEFRNKLKVHNHFMNNFLIGNKKALFQTMTEYYSSCNQEVFEYLPLTFHIKNGLQDDQYLKFLQHFYSIAKGNKANPDSLNKFNAWIVKPGQNTNRGNGIIVCLDLNEIKTILKKKEKHNDGTYKTYILQKYIERPLLYRKRKFDIRHYIMLNCVNGTMKGYWYKYGYVRTTSSEYTLEISSGSVHLTNDAVQKNLPDYGKYQKGNKITYEELQAFIKKIDPSFNFFEGVYSKMKKIATNAIHASALSIDPVKRVNNFEVFGLDFMIDANYNVWLIEINTNPCLQTTCPVLNKIIPRFIENTFQICLDPLFPAPLGFEPKYQEYYKNTNQQNDLQLVFDERVDRVKVIGQQLLANTPEEDEDTFDDDGEDFQD